MTKMEKLVNRAWAEIDLDCIAHNVREIRRVTGPHVELMAVVKADAYGHGVRETVQTMVEAGATRLAVSMLDEALELRKLGIEVPILVLGYTDPKRAREVIRNGITQTVFSHDLAQALSVAAQSEALPARVHVKIDTGMSRVGFLPGYAAVKAVASISALPKVVIEGIFTHFASADEADDTYTRRQFEQFESILSELNRVGILIPLRHAANSAATLAYPDMALDMVRPGIILYGLMPSPETVPVLPEGMTLDLKPAMSLKAHVILVKEIGPGMPVSYGRTWTATRPTRIATLPVGYADGFSRACSNKARVMIHGEYAPVVGNVCMDQCMVDVTHLSTPVLPGDEAVLFGSQLGKTIPVEELAAHAGTIAYETVCLVGKRIPRVYRRYGEIVMIHNALL